MEKPSLTPNQYMVELNRCLRQHQDYRKCMAFVPNPEGATGSAMSGYTVAGPFELMGIYAQVAHEVAEHFDQRL